MHKITVSNAKQLCRELRKKQTKSERILWESLRNRNLLGKKFNRQYPLFFKDASGKDCFYIADFYCHEYRLIIELDGQYHSYQQEYDITRTDILKGMGLTVLRFQNHDIEKCLDFVLKRISDLLI